jgi:CRISPR/Cas system-associated exonuclease Cas4 (RecB family)
VSHLVVSPDGKRFELCGEAEDDGTPPCNTTTEPVKVESVSVSQLNSFGRCKRRWFFQKVRRVPLPPKARPAAAMGQEIHRLHEHYYKKGFVPKGHQHERKVLASLENLPKCGPGVEAELPFRIEEANEVPFTGVIDLVDRRMMMLSAGGTLRIIDHKTTSSIASKEANPVDVSTDPQMLTYAEVGYREGAERVEVAHNTISTTHVARILPPVFVHIPREIAAENWAAQRRTIRMMVVCAAAPPSDWNDVPCNTEACFDFGGCDYLPICALKTPTIGVAPMSHDENAASALLARLTALSAPIPPPAAPSSQVIEVIDETPTTPIALTETAEIVIDSSKMAEIVEVQLLPPDAPSRMTPLEVVEEKPAKAKRGRKAKEATETKALSVEYFTEKSIGNVDEAVAYLNERAEEGVRLMGIFDGLYFIFERPRY